jgi:hypothetical protein
MMSDDAPPDGGNASKPMREALNSALRRQARTATARALKC